MSGPVWAECGEVGGRRRVWRTRRDHDAYNAGLDHVKAEYGRRRRAAIDADDHQEGAVLLREANAWRRREMRRLERYYVVVDPAIDHAAIERQQERRVAPRPARRTGTRARGAGRPAARRTRSTSSSSSSDDSGPSDPPPASAESPSLAPHPTQRDRVLAALRRVGPRGLTLIDFLAPNVVDGGRPVLALAARVAELRREGYAITSRITKVGDAHMALYRLVSHEPAPARSAEAGIEQQDALDLGDLRRRPASPLDPEVA